MVSGLAGLIAGELGGKMSWEWPGLASPWYTHCTLSQLLPGHVPLCMVNPVFLSFWRRLEPDTIIYCYLYDCGKSSALLAHL